MCFSELSFTRDHELELELILSRKLWERGGSGRCVARRKASNMQVGRLWPSVPSRSWSCLYRQTNGRYSLVFTLECIADTLAEHHLSENADASLRVNGPDEQVIEGEISRISDEASPRRRKSRIATVLEKAHGVTPGTQASCKAY